MYDGYAIFSSLEELKKEFACESDVELKPNYQASPAQLLPVILSQNPSQIEHVYWGIPKQAAQNKSVSKKLINLSFQQALDRPMYKKLLDTHRCIILANGFFDWRKVGKRQKTPYFCHLANKTPFAIAGIWDEYEDFEGISHRTFNMLLTDKGTSETFESERPALLTKNASLTWLNHTSDPSSLSDAIQDFNDSNIVSYSVNPSLLSSAINLPDVIKPSLPADQFGNYTLFN